MRHSVMALAIGLVLAITAPAAASGFKTVSASAWNRAAVERVLHVFAYGGRVSEAQIQQWVAMGPVAIRQMLTFQPNNPYLAAPVDTLSASTSSLQQLQALLASDGSLNPLCPSVRANFTVYEPTSAGEVSYSLLGVQRTWLAAAHLHGSNPFRHKVGLWLTNYLMATSPGHTKINLTRDHYDTAMRLLAVGAPLWRVLAEGAASAAIASEYGHRYATFDNTTGVFSGSDDFAREFHQLFFKINGVVDGADYHENTTIENTAQLLTGMAIDQAPPSTGVPLEDEDWLIAPIDFTDHIDATGVTIRNRTLHHQAPLEILHATITGANAEEKLRDLARVAIMHPESLDNLPVEIVRFFGDDNLTAEKIAAIREDWKGRVGGYNDLLNFLRRYATSTTFHDPSTFKYMTGFDQAIIPWNISDSGNDEFYTTYSLPITFLSSINTMPFEPIFRIFGHQTGLDAANDATLFRTVYNQSVSGGGPMAVQTTCKDLNGATAWSWQRDWSQIIPKMDNRYAVGDVARWLWQRFTGDSGANYTALERAHLAAILARRTDLATLIDPLHPSAIYRAADLESQPLASLVADLEASELPLDSSDATQRLKANTNVAMAVNFIRATPFAFAVEAR